MKSKVIILLGGLFIIGIIFFVFKKSPEVTNYPNDGKTIVAFGDSLVRGVGSTLGKDFVSLLSVKIGEPIINLGAPGNTSGDGLELVGEVNKLDPKIVLVLFGGNDFLRKVPLEQTFKNIDEIVVKLQEKGSAVVLLGIKGGLLGDHYDEHFEEIAKRRGTLYVPNVLAGLLGKDEFMSDTIHPNDLGYKKIAEKIYPELEKILD